jgi:hypothetical protein
MKQALQNPIMVSIEYQVVEDIIKIIGGIIQHKYGYCHDEIDGVKRYLMNKAEECIHDREPRKED